MTRSSTNPSGRITLVINHPSRTQQPRCYHALIQWIPSIQEGQQEASLVGGFGQSHAVSELLEFWSMAYPMFFIISKFLFLKACISKNTKIFSFDQIQKNVKFWGSHYVRRSALHLDVFRLHFPSKFYILRNFEQLTSLLKLASYDFTETPLSKKNQQIFLEP